MKGRIVIKIGSQILTKKDGTLNITQMSSLVDQLAELHKNNYEIILVSSGAVAAGKSEIQPKFKLDSVSSRQLFSTIGQVKLIQRYYDLFKQYNIVCGQILATKDDFSTRKHYLNQRNCMKVMIENGVIPIVNENDAISVNELMFTDNDELSGLVATMMNCSKLIILSNIDGIYTGNPSNPESSLIEKIYPGDDHIKQYIQTTKSSAGRGGMKSKYNIAKKVAEEGVEVIIANGETSNILIDLLNNNAIKSTTFITSKKSTSNIKKWIAHSEDFSKGKIYINAGAKDALLGNKAISILPVGVVKITGEFEEGDIVEILDENENSIGVGCSSYTSNEAKNCIGLNNLKPIIHYDYLYIGK